MQPVCEFCPGAAVELTRRAIRGGSVQYVRQCTQCGEVVGSAVAKARVVELTGSLDVPEFDAGRAVAYRGRQAQEHAQQEQARKAAWFEQYSAYLESPAWALKRELVLKRASGTCEGCGVEPADQVHHLSYDNVGAEFLFELVAICSACHERFHESAEKRRNQDQRFTWGGQ